MKRKNYAKEQWKVIIVTFIGIVAYVSASAQVYTDTTGLIADLEAGIFEEYVLAPASVTDTFFLGRQINIKGSAIIRAKEDLGFKPVVTGNRENKPGFLFYFSGIIGGADFELQGLKFIGSANGVPLINTGTARIESEDINYTVRDCEFHDYEGWDAIAKYYNSGGDVTVENVIVNNCAGKIIQITYKDGDSTPDYVPKFGDINITNSTFANIYDRIFFELGVGNTPISGGGTQRFNAGAKNFTIDHCTFYGFKGVNVAQGRALYEWAGDMTAIENKLSITNTIFSNMDQNLNADSASTTLFDYNYIAGFGKADGWVTEDFDVEYGATNTITIDPVFADTTNGNWDLTLQNEADIIGSDGRPIGDPRWYTGIWYPTKISDKISGDNFAKVYSYSNKAIISTNDNVQGSISVFSITGQLVRKLNIDSKRTELSLNNGLYIIKLDTQVGSMAKKIVIVE